MKNFKVGDIICIPELVSIGIIINKGEENTETWYRTDCDGIRYEDEMKKVHSVEELQELVDKGYQVAPSTVKKITEKFVY